MQKGQPEAFFSNRQTKDLWQEGFVYFLHMYGKQLLDRDSAFLAFGNIFQAATFSEIYQVTTIRLYKEMTEILIMFYQFSNGFR